MQDLRHPQSNGRLSGAGIAGKAHVQGGWFRLQPELTPRAFNKQQRRDLPDSCFNGYESDKLAIKLIKRFADTRLGKEIGEIDALGGFRW
jgi:hypothetical protein